MIAIKAVRVAVRPCVRPVRKVCEHFCFGGALVDFVGFTIHSEAYLIVFAGKLAFVLGALAVYALHIEEAKPLD